MANMKKLSIVVPMYNEEEGASTFLSVLHETLDTITTYEKEVVVVNDGSKDKTLSILKAELDNYDDLIIVNLSRNFGHERAIAAGLSTCSGDLIVPMDADLQDPPSLIPELIRKYEEGYDVVNAKRRTRNKDSYMKRATASAFYRTIRHFAGDLEIPDDVGHFRLISRPVLDKVISLNEYIRVFRLEVPFVGYKTCEILFDRPDRAMGKTHYNYKRMLNLASDSIVSTSTKPLDYILKATIGCIILTLLAAIALIVTFAVDRGLSLNLISSIYYVIWLVAVIFLIFFDLLMCSLSILSKYIGGTFLEAQKRPAFIIEEIIKK